MYMCDTCGLITVNSTCPFGTSWSQLYVCPTVDHVSSNGGHRHGFRMDGCRKRTAALYLALLMYIRYVCTHACALSECTYRSIDMCDAICSHKTTGGLVCPPCKVHGELMGGLSSPMHCIESVISKDAVPPFHMRT